MSVIERSTTIQPFERAVFVTDDDRRARRMRRGAFAATALACLWVVGLGLGMFGFGSLPGVSLIKPGPDGSKSEAPRAESAGGEGIVRQRRSLDPLGRLITRGRSGVVQASASQHSVKTAQRARPFTPPRSTPPAVPPAQQPVNPAQRQRGWARNGLTAPPGQTRTVQPPPTSQGQRRGQTTTTSTTTWDPPGQAKKISPTGYRDYPLAQRHL